MKFEKSNPILFSRDVKRSLMFYTEILGFTDSWEWGHPTDFGGVVRDGVELFFCLNDQGNPGTWVAIILDNVDEYFESIKDKGITILMPPTSQEWNILEMMVEDPDGHVIRFGHRIECD